MRPFFLGVVVCGLLGAARPALTQDGDSLALQARAILRSHCASCHGARPDAKAKLNVGNLQGLSDNRRLVQPGDAAASLLIDLVAGASMPPGNHERVPAKDVEVLRQWIDAGAPQVPAPGDDYVIRRIVRDWQQGKFPAAARPAVRYLSLNHLLAGEGGAERLEAARKDLEAALTATGRGPAKLLAIDPENSVYRILLTDLGWEKKVFGEIIEVEDKDKRVGDAPLNLHDLALLEYPYSFLRFSSPEYPALAGMLRQAKAVRPIPYVRGDWLAAVLTGSPLGREIALALKRQTPELGESPFFQGKVGVEAAAAELGWKKGLDELQKKLAEAGLKELGRGEAVTRQTWEKEFARVVGRLEMGKAIAPLDGLSVLDYRSDSDLVLKLATSNDKRKLTKLFHPNDRLQVRIHPDRTAFVELINTTEAGTAIPIVPAVEYLGGRPTHEPEKGGNRVLDDHFGTERLTAFAVAKGEHLPADAKSFPKGKIFRADNLPAVRDRFVHLDLYKLRDDDKDFHSPAAAHMVKVTIEFEIARKK